MVDYIDFTLERAKALQEHLVASNTNHPEFVSNFYRQREYYDALDRQKHDSARPAFIFCGLMHEACTIIGKKGDAINSGTYGCLKLASDVVAFMVLSIQQPESILSLEEQAKGKLLAEELKDLEKDFQFNRSQLWNNNDETFCRKVDTQLQYLLSTKSGLEKVLKTT